MEQYRIVLGIEIGKDFLRAAEVEHRGDKYFLSRIAERKIETLAVDELVQTISLLMNEETILSRVASVAIDTRLTQRDTVDVDSDLLPDEMANFLNAEIDFHNDFAEQGYRPAYEVIRNNNNAYKEVFYAAVKKELLNSVKNACTRCGMHLQFIDLDHSCSELSVSKIMKPSGNFILLTVKERQVEGSYCKSGERLAYKYDNYSGEPFYLATKIANDLESQINEYAETIYVTGVSADSFLIDLLQKSVDKRYELLTPHQHVLLSPVVSMNTRLNTSPNLFSSVIGAALK